MKNRLGRGRSWLTGSLGQVLGERLDEDSIEQLEEQLLLADAGIEATANIVAELGKTSSRDRHPREMLHSILERLLLPLERPLVIPRDKRPFVILVVGVNGAGKTTSIGKLTHYLGQQGHRVLLAAADTFRAAAVEQLQQWGERNAVAVIAQAGGADPAAVVHDALRAAAARDCDVVIADTAGRLHTASGLMDELAKIRRVIEKFDAEAPHEVILVLDATQGQNALAQAREFQQQLGVTGLILTKLDGSAKGGIVLALAGALGIPVRFLGAGEQLEDFTPFRAADFAAALAGRDDP